jgi:hypothetical protein
VLRLIIDWFYQNRPFHATWNYLDENSLPVSVDCGEAARAKKGIMKAKGIMTDKGQG